MTSEYSEYLQLDALFGLQRTRLSPSDSNEALFIISHQGAELWCKQLLSELRHFRLSLEDGNIRSCTLSIYRCNRIFESLHSIFEVLGTLSPSQFAAFRHLLKGASGAQSLQFHSLDILLGIRSNGILRFFPEGSPERTILTELLSETSIVSHVEIFFKNTAQQWTHLQRPIANHDVLSLNRDQGSLANSDEHVQVSSRELVPLLRELDKNYQKWHLLHHETAFRLIGDLPGTGGTEGAHYLRKKIDRTLFPFLWSEEKETEAIHAN